MALEDVLDEQAGETPNHNYLLENGSENGNGIVASKSELKDATELSEIVQEHAEDCNCDFCYFGNDANFSKPSPKTKPEPWYVRYGGYAKIALGSTAATISSFLHCYYYWCHDFAHNKTVSVPLWWPELKFTGYEWEALNFFGGELVSIILMAAAGCLMAQGFEHNDKIIDRHKDLSARKTKESEEYRSLIKKYAPQIKSLADKIKAKYHSAKDKKLLISKEEEERIYAQKHPWRHKFEKIFSKPAALPTAMAVHTGLMFAIYKWWSDVYGNGQKFLSEGAVNITEGMAWNYAVVPSLITLWFVGLSAYYFWKTPVEKQTENKKYQK